MNQPATDTEARLIYLKRELVKSVTHSRHFNQLTCEYNPPRARMPARVKRLMAEIDQLEKEGK